MTQPAFVPRDVARFQTRRMRDGALWTVPRESIAQAIFFILAVVAQRMQIGIAGFVVMGNHIHIIMFDLNPFSNEPSRLDDFTQIVHSHISDYLGVYWEISGSKFDSDSKNHKVLLGDWEAELDKLVYTICNPVKAGIVADPLLMGLAVSDPDYYRKPITIERPEKWFSKRNWPDEVKFKLTVPPLAHMAGFQAHDWADLVEERVEKRRTKIARQRKKDGKRGWVGIIRAREMGPWEQRERKGNGFADAKATAANEDARRNILQRVDDFRADYRACLKRLREGHDVEFPLGTSLLARRHGVKTRYQPTNVAAYGRWLAVHMFMSP